MIGSSIPRSSSSLFTTTRFHFPGNLNGGGFIFAMHSVSKPLVVPVRNSWYRMEREQSFSGVWAAPATTSSIEFGMYDFAMSLELGGREAGSAAPDITTAGVCT